MRAITNAAALELRPHGIQVTLLIVDAGIQPLYGSTRPGMSPEAMADPHRVADAVLFLANQDARSATHELQLTPLRTGRPNGSCRSGGWFELCRFGVGCDAPQSPAERDEGPGVWCRESCYNPYEKSYDFIGGLMPRGKKRSNVKTRQTRQASPSNLRPAVPALTIEEGRKRLHSIAGQFNKLTKPSGSLLERAQSVGSYRKGGLLLVPEIDALAELERLEEAKRENEELLMSSRTWASSCSRRSGSRNPPQLTS